MAKVYTNTFKTVLADGTIKIYSYQKTRFPHLSDKKILFNELKENEQFKAILANTDLNKVEKFEKSYELTRNNEKFKVFTQNQIKNLIYRIC